MQSMRLGSERILLVRSSLLCRCLAYYTVRAAMLLVLLAFAEWCVRCSPCCLALLSEAYWVTAQLYVQGVSQDLANAHAHTSTVHVGSWLGLFGEYRKADDETIDFLFALRPILIKLMLLKIRFALIPNACLSRSLGGTDFFLSCCCKKNHPLLKNQDL